MEGIIDDEPVNNPTAGAGVGQAGPFGDLVSQFQMNRNSGAGAGKYGGYAPYQQQQQPVMDWGQGLNTTQQAAMAQMTGYGAGLDPAAAAAGDMDMDGGYAKRQRMGEAALMAAGNMHGGAPPHASSSNQLQALGNQGGWGQQAGGLVEGSDLTQVYEAARAQQQQMQGAAYGAQPAGGYSGYGAGLMDNGYAEQPINQLGPSDLQQQMYMQQQQQIAPGQYNLNQGGGRTRLDRIGQQGYSSRVPAAAPASQGPSRLTTGHKHAEYLQNLVRARFNTPAVAGATDRSMVTRSTTNSYQAQQHGMQQGMQQGYGQFYPPYGAVPQREEDGEEADQVLSKCEAVCILLVPCWCAAVPVFSLAWLVLGCSAKPLLWAWGAVLGLPEACVVVALGGKALHVLSTTASSCGNRKHRWRPVT